MKTMKTTLCLASLALAILSGTSNGRCAAEQPRLNENLKPLAWMVGRWDVQFTGENGKSMKARYNARVGALGAIITGTWETASDTFTYTNVRTWFWQPETKSIACVAFDSFGAHGAGVVTKLTDQALIWQASAYNRDGQFVTSVCHVEIKDNDSFVYYTTDVVVAGEPQPDGPKLTFKRIKQ